MILVSGKVYIAQGMSRWKIRKGSPQRNVPNEGGVGFSAIFNQYVVISKNGAF